MAAVLLFVGATTAFGQGISTSAHDFSGSGWANGEICLPCHAPHNNQNAATTLLWNHDATVASFTPYSNATSLNATVGQPDGESLICLSCHDGTVALDSYGGTTGTQFIGTVAPTALVGTDLSNDHPVSFTYDDALAGADGGLNTPSTFNTLLGGTIDEDLLYGGKMQCSSCHDVHNAHGNPSLLNIDNTGSVLCLTCHSK